MRGRTRDGDLDCPSFRFLLENGFGTSCVSQYWRCFPALPPGKPGGFDGESPASVYSHRVHRPVPAAPLSSVGHASGGGHRQLTREVRGFSRHPQTWISPTNCRVFPYRHAHTPCRYWVKTGAHGPGRRPFETTIRDREAQGENHETMDSPAFRRGHRGHGGPLRDYRGRPSRPTNRARRMEVTRRPQEHRYTVATRGRTTI